jgi:4-hydroxythreonine-4-phosphate dehydrogenase
MRSIALALTLGEPSGIGPDILVQLAQSPQSVPLIIYADPNVISQRAQQLGLSILFHPLDSITSDGLSQLHPLPAGEMYLRAFSCKVAVVPGQLEIANADYVLTCLRVAAHDCLRFPERLGLVTGPIQKSIINDAGIAFSGHTEFLQEIAGVDKVVMMLATQQLRVALVTTHMALRNVADAITAQNVSRTLEIIHSDMKRYFTRGLPAILVCGLNPHAGESGHLGIEELTIIEPVLQRLRSEGMKLIGPVPADTAFTVASLHDIDVVVAMYHDQGLPVLKAQGFGEAINITLGLPFVRTSVDHGTALVLAGTGKAKHSSLQQAIQATASMLYKAMGYE